MIGFAATQDETRAGIGTIMERLAKLDLNGDDLGTVEIILAEVANNIVEHAYAGAADGQILIAYRVIGTRLTLQITDCGNGFPGDRLPRGRAADIAKPRSDMPEGGFGWRMIRELASTISYDRHQGLNRLFISLDLAGQPH